MKTTANRVSRRILVLLPIFLIVALAMPVAAAEDFSAEGPHKIETLETTWTDAARADRAVPVKIYYPADLTGPAPVVMISHGLGGSREGYVYLGRHLASHGYITVHITHIGSDTDALRDAFGGNAANDRQAIMDALKKVVANLDNAINRPKDVSFAIDRLLDLNKGDGPLRGHIDAEKIGVAGHSFGAFTAMAVAGQTFPRGANFREPRIKAAVAMSPPVQKPQARQYESITIPLLMMTGTLDESPLGTGGGADERQKIFDMLTHCDRYLLIFDGGDHMVFSGRPKGMELVNLPGARGDGSKDPRFQAFIKASTLQFFNAYLRDDTSARKWLISEDGAKSTLGKDGTWKHADKHGS